MKYFVEVKNGSSFEIDVERKSESEFRVCLEGREMDVDFFDVDGLGQFAARIGDRSFAASIEEADQQHLFITAGKDCFQIFATDEREHAVSEMTTKAPESETVVSPMPGIVAEINVEVGDHIEQDQCVLILEAMKMQNEVRAQHGGIVEAVFVEAGQSVSGNEKLVELRNDSAGDEEE
jgi:biotin carboxyl carrier protein